MTGKTKRALQYLGERAELHLETPFMAHGILFARGAETDNRNKPDFLFPGAAEYHDKEFRVARLTMLRGKSTLKDRWRQVLSEARRIKHKHPCTRYLRSSDKPGQAEKIQLVVPEKIYETFRAGQRAWLMKVSDVVNLVRERQV